jgi:hypothetical protein
VLDLGVALEAKIRIALHQQLAIDRTVGSVANGATLAESFVLENEWARLLAMTVTAVFVQSRHRQASRRFEDVRAVRIVALNAIHATFDNRMMLRQIEFSARLQMAFEADARILPGINNEFSSPSAAFNVFAARAVARLASALAVQRRTSHVHARVRTCCKHARDVRMAVIANLIADIGGSGDLRGGDYCLLQTTARTEQNSGACNHARKRNRQRLARRN